MVDNRKHSIVVKIARKVVDFYEAAAAIFVKESKVMSSVINNRQGKVCKSATPILEGRTGS